MEEPAPHFSYTGRRDPLRSVRQLKARPVIMGAKGKWIRGDVSWNTLSYLNFRRECNEAHVEWMQAFLAAHTAAANRVHSSAALWLGLNTFAGKNLWSLLAEARKIGVALVHSRGHEPVRLAESPAAVGLNLSRTARRERRRPASRQRPTTAGWSSRPPSPLRGKRWIRRRWGPSAARRTASS